MRPMGVYRTDVVVQLSCRHKRSEKGNNKREGEGEKKREKERTSFMPAITVFLPNPSITPLSLDYPGGTLSLHH